MKAVVKNLAVDYIDHGKGPVVVLLHGWGVKAGNLEPLIKDLSKDHRVIAPDLPGFGGSERPAQDWGVPEYAIFLSELLAKLKINEVAVLIGHSFGGRVGVVAAADNLLEPERLVLLSTPGVRQVDSIRNRTLRAVSKIGKAVTSLPLFSLLRGGLRQRFYRAIGSTDYLAAGAMRGTFLKVINQDLREACGRISTPTLLVYGEQDVDVPVKEGQTLANHIKQSRFEIVPGANHFVHLDRGPEVIKLIRDFING